MQPRVEPKGWLEVAIKFGVPALIACYLVYVMAERIEPKIDTAISAISAHAALGEHQAKAMDTLIEIAREQCVNSAIMAKKNPKECLK